MPWKRLSPEAKKAAVKHGRRKPSHRSGDLRCWSYKRSQLMTQHGLGFWGKVRFWLASDK